jgi:hypothetical protein
MLPLGYDPQNYGGEIWWNEHNPKMRAIWGTQKDYDAHIQNGGTWEEYAHLVQTRMNAIIEEKDLNIPPIHKK